MISITTKMTFNINVCVFVWKHHAHCSNELREFCIKWRSKSLMQMNRTKCYHTWSLSYVLVYTLCQPQFHTHSRFYCLNISICKIYVYISSFSSWYAVWKCLDVILYKNAEFLQFSVFLTLWRDLNTIH
jgi:hypothetical protein